jgi:Ca2+-binding RTX toxin-like protein
MGSGYEIAYTGNLGKDLTGKLVVYLDADPNPMTAEAWATYVPPAGYSLNTPRTTCFDVLDLLGSPDVPAGQYTPLTTSDGYTWISVAALARSVYPYLPLTVDGVTLSPQQIAYSLSTPPPGVIIVDSNDKNHSNTHWGLDGAHAGAAHLQYFIMDPWDNKYILKSVNSKYDTPEKFAEAVAAAVLPKGWVKLAPEFFRQDVAYTPIYSGLNDSLAHANEFRDSADSAWTQIEWGAAGITLNAMTAGGLPIWGGQGGGRLLGNEQSNVIYGGQGADSIFGLTGDDAIYAGGSYDVIDGGLGSNFLSGGAGMDSFFVDGRATNGPSTWSTIADFSPGEHVTIWGYQPGLSKLAWAANGGAAGYTGATLHGDLDGNGQVDTSITFSGLTQAQLPTPSFGSSNGYDYIHIG